MLFICLAVADAELVIMLMLTLMLCADTSGLRWNFQVSLSTIDFSICDIRDLAFLGFFWFKVLDKNSLLATNIAQMQVTIVKNWHLRGHNNKKNTFLSIA